jgi:two-component system chemotaxis response regulator CheB
VDDQSLFRRVISDALSGLPGVEVIGSAMNGKTALARIASLQPDLVTLDIEMPEMNGLEVLEAMRHSGFRTSVIMLSAHTKRGSEMTIRALESGAFDFIAKPDGGSRRKGSPIVLIGVSTGGPTALAEVLPALPARMGAPIFIVQHMPPLFTGALAERLNAKSAITVKEAQDGETAHADCAYLAPGGRHMRIAPGPSGEIVIRITDDAPEHACRPSVDYLFRSAALQFPGRAIAAILTGMGSDGTDGARLLKRAGSFTIAQDEATCTVFGMPREAIAAGVIDAIVPLNRVAETIARAVGEART